MLTPYQFASNSPIAAIDLDGLESKEVVTKEANGPYIPGLAPATETQIKRTTIEKVAELAKKVIKPAAAVPFMIVGFMLSPNTAHAPGTPPLVIDPRFSDSPDSPGDDNPIAIPKISETLGDNTLVEPGFGFDPILREEPYFPEPSLDDPRNEPHDTYEIFGFDPKSKEKETIKFGIYNKQRNPNRAKSQIEQPSQGDFRRVYSNGSDPRNKLGKSLIGINWRIVETYPNKQEALKREKVEVTIYNFNYGQNPPENKLPNPDQDLLNELKDNL